MTRAEIIFFSVIFINTVISIAYMVFGLVFAWRRTNDKTQKPGYVFRGVCMLLAPVLGIFFFIVSYAIQHFFFNEPVDLEDVIFSKEKSESISKADEERERNIVPISEALAVTDAQNSRRLLLNVIKGEVENSLASISLALDSMDTETSHYAASILSKALNDFRMKVRKIDAQIRSESADQGVLCITLIEYMNNILIQRVFTNVEQEYFVHMMADTGEFLLSLEEEEYRQEIEAKLAKATEDGIVPEEALAEEIPTEEPEGADVEEPEESDEPVIIDTLQPYHYAAITNRLTEIGALEEAMLWSKRAMTVYPEELESYRCRLQCLYKAGDREQFLITLNELKRSGVVFDNEIMEMIRVFG